MEWHEITINTRHEAVELIAAMLYDIGVKGVEIVDNFLTQEERDQLICDYFEEHLTIPTEQVQVKCYFSFEEDMKVKMQEIEEGLKNLESVIDIGAGTIETLVTKEEDWANNWKQYYKPFRIGKNILIKPTWEQVDDLSIHDIVIEIDPGMAFGSGTHETTSMCALLLQKYLKQGQDVMDVGCGSGILSIIAGKLGAKRVEAIDLDPAAVKVAKENVELNELEDKISVHQGNLLEHAQDPVDLVVANIVADIVILLTDDITRVLKTGGLFIASGIIGSRQQEVRDKIEASGFEIIEVMEDKDWIAITSRWSH